MTRNVVIDGGNYTLSGNNAYRLFTVASGTVTIQNANLINGRATGGTGGNGGGGGGGGGAGFANGFASNGSNGGSITGTAAAGGGAAGTNGGAGGASGSNGANPTGLGAGGGGGSGNYYSGGYTYAGGGGSGGSGGSYYTYTHKGSTYQDGGGGGGGSLGAGGAVYVAGGAVSFSNVNFNNDGVVGGAGGNGGSSSNYAYGGSGGNGGAGYGGALFAYTGTTLSLTAGSAFGTGDTATGGAAGAAGPGYRGSGYTGSTGTAYGKDVYLYGATLNYTVNSGTVAAGIVSTSGQSTLNKLGGGTLTLSESNSSNNFVYNVNAGTLATSVANVLGSNSTANLASGTTLLLGGTDQIGSVNGAGTVNLQGNSLSLYGVSPASGFTGQITGGGVFSLSNGAQSISAATLTSAAANIQLYGGVAELNDANANLTLGTGNGQVNLLYGGFAAIGGDRQVTLNNGAALTWGSTPGFFTTNGDLVLGASSADHTVTLTNALDLGATAREIDIYHGSGNTSALDAVLSGGITGSSTLTVYGNGFGRFSGNLSGGMGLTYDGYGSGSLELTGANTYTGATTINAGTMTFAAGSSLTGGGNMTVASGTTLNLNGNVNLGANTLSVNGTGTLGTTGALAAGTEYVGNNSVGAFTQAGGTNNATTLDLAYTTGVSGTYTLNGGAMSVANEYVGDNGAGVLNQNGGTNTVGGAVMLGRASTGGGTYDLNGGILQTTGVVRASGTGTFNFNGGTLQAGGNNTAFMQGLTAANVQTGGAMIDTNGYAVTIAQPLLHSGTTDGGLTKLGSGTLTLTGASTYTGATIINGGTLTLNNTGGQALATTSSFTVNPGGTLLTSQPDQVNHAADLTLNASSASVPALNTVGNLETFNHLTLASTSVIDLGSGASVVKFANSSLQNWNGILEVWNYSGKPLTGGGTDQLYFGTNPTGLTAAQLLDIRFYSDNGTTLLGIGSYALGANGEIVPTAIPEPSAWIALVGGVGLLGVMRRVRRVCPA